MGGRIVDKSMEKTLEQRIRDGIKYFEEIPPSKFNPGHVLHLKVFLKLLKSFLNGETVVLKDLRTEPRMQPDIIDEAKKIFTTE